VDPAQDNVIITRRSFNKRCLNTADSQTFRPMVKRKIHAQKQKYPKAFIIGQP
jgi:hypothetical protein